MVKNEHGEDEARYSDMKSKFICEELVEGRTVSGMLGTRIPKRMAKEKGSTRVQYYDSTVQFISTKFIPDPIFGRLRVCLSRRHSAYLNLPVRDKRLTLVFCDTTKISHKKTPGACSNIALECVYLIKWWLDKKSMRYLKCPTMSVRRWVRHSIGR